MVNGDGFLFTNDGEYKLTGFLPTPYSNNNSTSIPQLWLCKKLYSLATMSGLPPPLEKTSHIFIKTFVETLKTVKTLKK